MNTRERQIINPEDVGSLDFLMEPTQEKITQIELTMLEKSLAEAHYTPADLAPTPLVQEVANTITEGDNSFSFTALDNDLQQLGKILEPKANT